MAPQSCPSASCDSPPWDGQKFCNHSANYCHRQFWSFSPSVLWKGSDLFQRGGQNMKQAAGRGTSRYSIGIKSWPEVIVNWILMKIVFFCHLISHLWQKIAIVLAIFGHFLTLFSASDTVMLKKGILLIHHLQNWNLMMFFFLKSL